MASTNPAIELMFARNKLMHSDESVAKGRAFVPRASDVIARRIPAELLFSSNAAHFTATASMLMLA